MSSKLLLPASLSQTLILIPTTKPAAPPPHLSDPQRLGCSSPSSSSVLPPFGSPMPPTGSSPPQSHAPRHYALALLLHNLSNSLSDDQVMPFATSRGCPSSAFYLQPPAPRDCGSLCCELM